MVSQPGQRPIPPGSAHKKSKKDVTQKNSLCIYEDRRYRDTRMIEIRELNQLRLKLDIVGQPVKTARTFVNHLRVQ